MMPTQFCRNISQNSRRTTAVISRLDSTLLQRLTLEVLQRVKETSPIQNNKPTIKIKKWQLKPNKLPSLKATKDYGLSEEEKQQYGDRTPLGFDKIEVLGRGGFALVWLAQHGGQKVALKQISKTNPQNEMRFNYIQSDNIIQIIGVEHTPRDVWIIQEVGGKTLGKALYTMKGEFYKGERVYGITETAYMQELQQHPIQFQQLLKGILNGIQKINENNVTHFDLKPDNILIDQNTNKPKIIDFGSAFNNDDQEQFGMITPEYMAPEVLDIMHNWGKYSQQYGNQISALNKKYGKPNVDVWSFGAIVLDILVGIPHWLSYKGKIVRDGKIQIKYGLFAVKGREMDKIMQKQSQIQLGNVVKNNSTFLSSKKQSQLYDLLKHCLAYDPSHRSEAKDLLEHQFFTEYC